MSRGDFEQRIAPPALRTRSLRATWADPNHPLLLTATLYLMHLYTTTRALYLRNMPGKGVVSAVKHLN